VPVIEAVVCEPGAGRHQAFQVSVELRVSASAPRPTPYEPTRRALASESDEPASPPRQQTADPTRAAAAYVAQARLMAAATRPRSRELHVRA